MREFGEAIFGPGRLDRTWTTGFVDIKGSPSWHGRSGFAHLERLGSQPIGLDLYFCIGEVREGADRRSLGNIAAQPLLIVDDIGTKIDRGKWDALFAVGCPEPSFRIETSPGNETWGWILRAPMADMGGEAWARDLALLRAWLVEKGLTDDVMDATRYIRLPGGWNSKDKYKDAAGVPPVVKLLAWDDGAKSLDAIGEAVLGKPDWADADMPVGGMNSAQIGGLGAGALVRTADLNDPEPLIQLAQELGMNARAGSSVGVVDANCPNIAAHGDRPETGFSFLGGGLAHCNHASCQHLTSADFRAMMEAEYDGRQEGKRALGTLAPGEPDYAGEFMWQAEMSRQGVEGEKDGAALEAEADAMIGAAGERAAVQESER